VRARTRGAGRARPHRREREIARLAAAACPTAAFAERLVIAVRTVDNHLHRAYAKLGVGSRGELAPLLLGPRQTPETGAERIRRASRSCLR
jgi:DNA-binding CsgD family transcriptional regulator